MSALLITWGRFFREVNGETAKVTIPAPPTDPGVPWLWNYLANNAKELSQHFDGLQLPPIPKVQGGAGLGCDGYGTFDLRDFGSKHQQGSVATRYGTKEMLQRMVAVSHANGLDIWLDIALHQLIGENGGPGVFKYLGADGTTLNGRGQSAPGWFRGNTGNNDPVPPFCKEDGVPVPFDDYPFGREKSFQNCSPHRVTINDAIDASNQQFEQIDGDGARFDDTKGTWSQFVQEFMTSGRMAKKPFYSEYFDGNPLNENWWATAWPMNGRSGVEDFTLHWAIQAVCNNSDNAHLLDGAGYAAMRSDLAYGFVDNPDTDTSPGQQVIGSKLLGYAFLSAIPLRGLLVYGKDYFGHNVWAGAYGLKPYIDNLMWISRTLGFGPVQTRFVDQKVIVLERNGQGGSQGTGPGLLTALNFDVWNNRTVTVQTAFWPGTHLHDFTGHHPDIWCDSRGRATFTIPKNANYSGQSYCCFSWIGMTGAVVANPGRSTTQAFEGVGDLDLLPAGPVATQTGTIWCAKGSWINLNVTYGAGVQFEVNPVPVVVETPGPDAPPVPVLPTVIALGGLYGHVVSEGPHVITVIAPAPATPYKVFVTYTAPAVVSV